MPLTHQHQLSLLKDILNEHQTECCGSVAECEQLERLVKSLMVNPNIQENLMSTLDEVYQYGQSGRNSPNLDNHILSHQENLSQWVDHVNSYC
ncbi:YtzH-like family protein [Heyndrickxia acidicola]|uniref:YtzH-like family protein n=1 Tax=Heyndrickxia acidicola TaxID=209389 RepID=A0ABU6MES2_9BACI|nr:YtzH-like family protein [Heyndrickxia acidicola]MED1203153.1 YtzH-like family protein [Heyndrickxia acidicola]